MARHPALLETGLLLLLLLVASGWSGDATKEDPNAPAPGRFKIWGPGLRSDFHLPVRYFFIQTVDKAGRNMTERLPDNFQILIRDVAYKDEIVSYSHIMYLHDGLYVFLMRLHYSVEHSHVNITLMYKLELVSDSPVYLRKPLYSEACHCPQKGLSDWLERLQCPKTYDQIDDDFQPFKSIDMDQVLDGFLKNIFSEGSVAVCRYVLRSNQIFRKCYGKHIGFHMFADEILISLTRKVVLPDMDFLWNLGDWPLSRKDLPPLPIISWCGSKDSNDIVLPTYELTESVLEMMGRVSLDIFNIMSQVMTPWKQRANIGFFRGRDSSEERLKLVRLSLKRPTLLDARLTNMFFFKNDSSLGQIAPYVSMFEFFKYKYQINMDGTVAPYRTAYLLAGGSVMLKQDSPYYEHFYSMLRPNVHFVPLQRGIDDVVDKLAWLRTHDSEARRIAENGREFALSQLTPQAIFCYHGRVFERYASVQRLRAADESPGPEFERVVRTEHTRVEECQCQPDRVEHDEL